MRMLRDSSIRCTTSQCALPMINLGYLDRDWYGEQVHLTASVSLGVPAEVPAFWGPHQRRVGCAQQWYDGSVHLPACGLVLML